MKKVVKTGGKGWQLKYAISPSRKNLQNSQYETTTMPPITQNMSLCHSIV